MNDLSDAQLLRDYAERGYEAAFREIVERHTDLLYSAALRQMESSDAAADITQSVLVDLARKAGTVGGQLPTNASLAGWLHCATRYAALNHWRKTRRRLANERQAMEQLLTNSESPVDWEQIRPTLDEALDSLNDEDREALLLRYFKKQDFRAVGLALGMSDDAAQKRVTRAVERLREFFSKRNVSIGASGLAVLISTNAVQSAPIGLAATISATAVLTGAAVSTSAVITTTAKTIAMTTLQKAVITAALATSIGAGVFEAHQASQARARNQILQQRQAPHAEEIQQLQYEFADVTNQLAAVLAENERLQSGSDKLELLKLRGEVALLRQQSKELPSSRASVLKQKLEEMPDKKTPELKFLTEKDWINAAWNADLDTDDGVRLALSKLRDEATDTFLGLTREALKKYLAGNNDLLPANLLPLKPYYDTSVTDEMLQRYAFMQTGKISSDRSKSVVRKAVYADPDYDSNQEMSLSGGGGGSFNQYHNDIYDATMAYTLANNGQTPNDSAQITSYLKRPVEDITMQKYFSEIVSNITADPPPTEQITITPALNAYKAANNGQYPKNPSDLLPYTKTPEQQTALQKVLQQYPASR